MSVDGTSCSSDFFTSEGTLKSSAARWFEEEFWPLWTVKVGKEAAKGAAKKIKPAEWSDVLRGVREQMTGIAMNDRPIHASSWLNQRRWEDDVSTVAKAEQRNQNGSLFPAKQTGTEKMMALVAHRMSIGMDPL